MSDGPPPDEVVAAEADADDRFRVLFAAAFALLARRGADRLRARSRGDGGGSVVAPALVVTASDWSDALAASGAADVFTAVYDRLERAAMTELDADGVFRGDPRTAARAHLQAVESWGPGIQQSVTDAVVAGLARGYTTGELIAAVAATVVGTGGAKAAAAAASAARAAASAARVFVFNLAGVSYWQAWITMEDARVRHDHAEAHGQLVPVGGLFAVGGEFLRYPCDPLGSAAQTINCRCELWLSTDRWNPDRLAAARARS